MSANRGKDFRYHGREKEKPLNRFHVLRDVKYMADKKLRRLLGRLEGLDKGEITSILVM